MSQNGFFIVALKQDYLAASGIALDYVHRARALGYHLSYRSRRVFCLSKPEMAVTEAAPFGATIGTVFGNRHSRYGEAPPDLTTKRSTDDFFHALREVWGSYVAIWDDPRDEGASLFRDPSGSLPCYYYHASDGTTLISSRADHIRDVSAIKPDIRWHVIRRMARNPHLRTHQTALEGVEELLPGYSLKIGANNVREIWSPWHFAEPALRIQRVEEATTLVRETIDRIMQCWASRLDQTIIGLSGGLDSSIVAASAAKTSLQAICLTITSGTASGDERYYARAAAADRFPLIEEALRIEDVNIRRSGASHCPRPLGRSLVQAIDAVNLRVAAQTGATAFLHGGGGDNVFCHLQSVAPIIDRLYCDGIGRPLTATLFDTCRAGDTDIWTAIGLCARRLIARRREYRWPDDLRFLDDGVRREDVPVVDHSWLRSPRHALPGSASHIAYILAIQTYIEGSDRELVAPVVAPLLAQPLVELCLRIPSWMWVSGGINRSVARRAFEKDLPATIIRRRSKGVPDGFAIQIFEANKSTIREMLCEGELWKHGIIDRNAVLDAFLDRGPVRNADYIRLLALCDMEAWLDSWN